MYELIKSTIAAGGYRLAEIRQKIKKLYLLGDITEEQMDELLALASSGVSADAERPENLTLIRDLADRLAELEERVKALEHPDTEEPTEPETPEYPAWQPWDGISNDYQPGAIVSHNGQLWQSVHNGQNVWAPGTPGLWEVYDPTEAA